MSSTQTQVRESSVVTLRVPVDFNARDSRGRLRVRKANLGAAKAGDSVIAFDQEDGTECSALVDEVRGEFGYLIFYVKTAREIRSDSGERRFSLDANQWNMESDGVKLPA